MAELGGYPTVATITNLVRSDVRDDMPGLTGQVGEGQILVDNTSISVTMANFFNSALRELCREMRIFSTPRLIVDNFIMSNIPPMNGPLGFQVADPSVQVSIGFGGYNDGGNVLQTAWSLPPSLYEPLRLWERQTSSNNTFADMGEPSNGLLGVYQTNGFGRWEWRQDMVVLPGSLDYRDLRLRYAMLVSAVFLTGIDPTNTYVPILDCEEAIARKIDRMYALRQGGAMYPMAKTESDLATTSFLNQIVHQMQGQEYPTLAYGNESMPVVQGGM